MTKVDSKKIEVEYQYPVTKEKLRREIENIARILDNHSQRIKKLEERMLLR